MNGGKYVRLYATRIGRKCFLEHFCPENESVLNTERHMVEIARSKMMEQLLSMYERSQIEQLKPAIKETIYKIACSSLSRYVEDGSDVNTVMQAIQKEIDQSFPLIH